MFGFATWFGRPDLKLKAACTALLLVLLVGCGSAPPRPEPNDAPDVQVPARLTLEQANDVTLYAISLVGTPYRFGGNTPSRALTAVV